MDPKIKHAKLVEVMKHLPLDQESSYYNFHNEEAFWFKGCDNDFQKLQKFILDSTSLKHISRDASLDTYLDFERNEYTKNLRNLRIRELTENGNKILVLIALFNAEPGNENVYVVRVYSKNRDSEIRQIQQYLQQFFSVKQTFQIEKVSKVLDIETLSVSGEDLLGEYLNVSFDEISFLSIGPKRYNPTDVFKWDKIVEIEYNSGTSQKNLTDVKTKIFSNKLFSQYSIPKKDKKSVMVEKWLLYSSHDSPHS